MKKLFNLLFLSGMLLGFGACTDLEEELQGDITEDINITGISTGGGSGASDILGGAFAELRNSGSANHSSYYSVQELTTDEMVIGAKGGDWFDGGILIELHQHSYTPTHDFINNAWNGQYNAINTCNELLSGGSLDNNQTAQIRALRAYFYMRLMDLYGNVKIITVSGEDQPQSSRAEVFAFVEQELLDAIGVSAISDGMDLSESPLGTDVNTYRINTYGALGIIAKLYLNAEVYTGNARWDEAAAAASYIIDSGVYSLW